jgi:hypothetical protein
MSIWTRFFDLHSGGFGKTEYETIYIEAPEDKAIEIFGIRMGRNPYNVTCDCCGSDYSVIEYKNDIEDAIEFDKRQGDKVLYIPQVDLTPEEKKILL